AAHLELSHAAGQPPAPRRLLAEPTGGFGEHRHSTRTPDGRGSSLGAAKSTLRSDSAGALVCDDLSVKGSRKRFRVGRGLEFQVEDCGPKDQGHSEHAGLDALAIEPGPDIRHWLGQAVAIVTNFDKVHAALPTKPLSPLVIVLHLRNGSKT